MKKVNRKISLFFIAVIILTACARKQYIVKSIEVTRVEMNSAWGSGTNTEMRTLVDSLKAEMTGEIQKIIGTAARTLTKDKPQSLLTNFTADAMLDYAAGLWGTVDFAVINTGGIRNNLNQGEISVGDIYEIFPFNNRLVLLELQGKDVEEFFDVVAKAGGEGLSKNIELTIKDKSVRSLKIKGEELDENKIYRIATIDYLAEGNDRMTAFTKAVKVTDSNLLIRDVLTDYIKKQTAENKAIDSNLDNRITIIP